MEGRKDDAGKPYRFELIAPEFLFGLSAVLTKGAQKYADRNWEQGMKWSRCFGAMMRHMWAWWGGRGPTTRSFLFGDLDDEWKFSHLWHAACCLMFLVAYEERGSGEDDRFRGENELLKERAPDFVERLKGLSPMPNFFVGDQPIEQQTFGELPTRLAQNESRDGPKVSTPEQLRRYKEQVGGYHPKDFAHVYCATCNSTGFVDSEHRLLADRTVCPDCKGAVIDLSSDSRPSDTEAPHAGQR